jgi:hypothetical protein
VDRIDLLSIIADEPGHLLGFEHSHGGVMTETLGTDMHTMPGAHE